MAWLHLVELDNVALTDQGRTYSQGRAEKVVEVELADGTLKQYVKAIKRTFNVEWQWLPNSDSKTYDGKAGRDTLKALCMDGTTHTLEIRDNTAAQTQNSYTVFVKNYSEQVVRRDFVSQVIYYNVTVEFVEQ